LTDEQKRPENPLSRLSRDQLGPRLPNMSDERSMLLEAADQ
jgi:hypothetical protein